MVRKITPTSGGWRKSFGSAEQQRAFEQSATRTLLAFSPTAAAWRDRTIHSLSALLTRRLHAPALLAAFRKFAEALVECEMPVLPEPATSSREPVEAVEHRRELRAMLSYTSHADQLFKEWIDAIAHLLGRIVDHIPEHATGPATSLLSVPLIEVLARPLDLVQHIVESLLRFARDETFPVRPGAVLAGRVQHALLRISKLTDEAACRNPHRLVPPTDSGLTGTELIATYLGNTPFSTLLTTPVPFTIPREFFCEHAVLIAGSGMGKTQCFQCIGLDLFRQPDPPAMFIVDSQDDEKGILHKIAHLDIFHPEHGRLRDRLLILSPEDKPALNLFKLGADDTERDELFTYLTSAIDRELTTKMATAATYILRLLDKIPTPTLRTFKDILENPKHYASYIDQLDEDTRDFFNNQFNVKSEMGATRLQVASRIYTLLGKKAFKDMFAAEENCFDAFRAMQEKKIVLVNTSRAQLGKVGSKVLGRYIVAQCMAAAIRRGASGQRDLALLILDEAHEYYDEQTEDILRTARKFNLGFMSATQMYEAIDHKVKVALAANTSIKLAGVVTDEDAQQLAKNMRTTKEAVLASAKAEFMTYVRGLTPNAVRLRIPFGVLEAEPTMDHAAYQRMRAKNRARVTTPYMPNAPKPSDPPRTLQPLPMRAPPRPRPEPNGSPPFVIKPGKDW